MKSKIIILLLTAISVFSLFQASALEATLSDEKIYELPYYSTEIMVSNVMSDNSDEYIRTINLENEDGPYQIKIVNDLFIEATAPCKITYGFGDQYLYYAIKNSDGTYYTDYSRNSIDFDVKKYTFFTEDENGTIYTGETVDIVNDDSLSNAGADGNYAMLGEGVYIVSNYSPEFRGARGQSFGDYSVVLTVKNPAPADAAPTSSKVYVDGVQKSFDAYNINGNNYFKLRDLAMVLNGSGKQFEVKWDATKNAVNLIPNEAYTPVGGEMARINNPVITKAVLSASRIYIDGQVKALTAYNINGNNYFKLRDIAKVFDFGLTWDEKTSSISIDTNKSYTD